jgi:SAM-dependent methyltransferase
MDRRFPGTRLRLLEADFAGPLALPPLDGILAANAIHFVRDQAALLRDWRGYLKPAGRLVVVEYDADDGNRWVPYPLSFAALSALAPAAGYAEPVLLGSRPSRFLGRIYAAVASLGRLKSALDGPDPARGRPAGSLSDSGRRATAPRRLAAPDRGHARLPPPPTEIGPDVSAMD